jgi:transcriptional antiterminator NusG
MPNRIDHTSRNSNNHAWLVVKTKPRAEKRLAQQLSSAGVEALVITYTSIRQWSNRKKKVTLPLINGIIFVPNTPEIFDVIYHYPQVLGILRDNDKYGLVTKEEIECLLKVASEWSGNKIEYLQANQNLSEGDLVEILDGEFKGLIGELVTIKGKHRLVVQMKSLNIGFTIELAKSKVKYLSGNSAA